MEKIELIKSCMAFQLKNGEVLLISKGDVEEIASKILVELIKNDKTKLFLQKDTAIERYNALYKVLVEQRDKMPEDIRNNYLKVMLQTIQEEPEFVPFKDHK